MLLLEQALCLQRAGDIALVDKKSYVMETVGVWADRGPPEAVQLI